MFLFMLTLQMAYWQHCQNVKNISNSTTKWKTVLDTCLVDYISPKYTVPGCDYNLQFY